MMNKMNKKTNNRLEIETFDANGKRIHRVLGPTQAELEAVHLAGKCTAFCSYCVTEAEELMALHK